MSKRSRTFGAEPSATNLSATEAVIEAGHAIMLGIAAQLEE